jgi:dipeptidyl-peptidase 4
VSEREGFPHRHARTRGFSLGEPRSFQVAADGSRVAFLRSAAGDDPVTALWTFDVETGTERLVCDPRELAGDDDLPDQERAMRERRRERASGIVGFGADREATVATFTLGGRLLAADLLRDEVVALGSAGGPVQARPDPSGRRVAYVANGDLRVLGLPGRDGGPDRAVAEEDDPDVTWGLPEFVAAEEMGRFQGYWWSPDGSALLAERADARGVLRWHIADPSDPARPPMVVRYPVAGGANADVTLSILRLDGAGLDGARVDVDWDREAFPYLIRAAWDEARPLLLVQSRDQRRSLVLEVDPGTGGVRTLREDRDERWLEVVDGVPARLADGRLVFTADVDDTRRLVLGDRPVTPPGLQVRSVAHVGEDVLVHASEEPTEVHVVRVGAGGEVEGLTGRPGVHTVWAGGDVTVIRSVTLESSSAATVVRRGGRVIGEIRSFAERPGIELEPKIRRLGHRELRSVLLLPTRPVEGPLPVLLDPYGGPHGQRVTASRRAFALPQWFADQGFAVLVADGRGMPGRGPGWERAVAGDLAGPALQDQVDALHAAAEAEPRLDLARVAIRGWSFGGTLAALGILRRPDVFRAAIIGAPCADWRLYDTFYTERYLGMPQEDPEAYRRSSPLSDAPGLRGAALIIHGLADDNVVVAHSIRLSRALLEAGRPHRVLPLAGVTHMTSAEVEANLLQLQVAFLREALGA